MAAQRDLDNGREPAEVIAIAIGNQVGGFGEVHFHRDACHPCFFAGFGKNADGGRIAAKRLRREGIDLDDWEGHLSIIDDEGNTLRNRAIMSPEAHACL